MNNYHLFCNSLLIIMFCSYLLNVYSMEEMKWCQKVLDKAQTHFLPAPPIIEKQYLSNNAMWSGHNPHVVSKQKVLTHIAQAHDSRQKLSKESVLKRVDGEDGRREVLETTTYPYRCIAGLDLIEDGDGIKDRKTYGGSGTLIGPRHLLTAAHCVFDLETGKWIDNITVYCGLRGKTEPYGSVKGLSAFVPERYIEQGNDGYDFALIVLDKDIGNQIGWLGVLSSNDDLLWKELSVMISGYPDDKGGGTSMFSMMYGIKNMTEDKFFYDIDTYEGQSGSPIYFEQQFQDIRHYLILGVHTHGEDLHDEGNSGVRLNQLKFMFIMRKILETFEIADLNRSDHLLSLAESCYKRRLLDEALTFAKNACSRHIINKADKDRADYILARCLLKQKNISSAQAVLEELVQHGIEKDLIIKALLKLAKMAVKDNNEEVAQKYRAEAYKVMK